VGVVLLATDAVDAETDPFLGTGYALTATLLALAVLEHWFLVLPLPDEALWSWAFQRRTKGGAPGPSVCRSRTPERPAPLIALRSH
jgi:hypothetical protein